MADTIFTKIIKGDIPCHKVYEDDKTLAFLDINPSNTGHTLVIPKAQVEFVWDLDGDDYQALMATVQKVARRLREVFGTTFVGEKIEGVDVPHAHVHLIPFNDIGQFKRIGTEADQSELAALAERLRFSD